MATVAFTTAAPRVPGGERVDVSSLVRDAEDRYAGAAVAYRRWRREGRLRVLEQPARWVLRVEPRSGAVVEGAVGALALDETVHPHEQVDAAVAARRAARLAAVPLDLSPVSTYAAAPTAALDSAVAASTSEPPALDLHDEVGTRFRLWPLAAPATFDADLAEVHVVVADGHHRVAAAVAARRAAAAVGPARTLAAVWTRPPPSQAVHRLLVGDVAAAHRRLLELGRMAGDAAPTADLAARLVEMPPTALGVSVEPGVAVAVAFDLLMDATARRDGRDTAGSRGWPESDQEVVHDRILPLLRGVRAVPVDDLDRLSAGVAQGGLGLLLRPVPADVVTRVAVAGRSLPAKSTSFRPKPRTGLLARSLQPQETGPA